MGRVVILEGPDGGGKTTLAKALVKEGFEYRHEGPPPPGEDIVAHYLKILDDSLKSEKNVVHDRLWLGERIYGPVARGVDTLGLEGQRLFERLHKSKPIHQYICIPKIHVARTNYLEKIKDKDDVLKCLHKWEDVFMRYARWSYNFGTIGSWFDYTSDYPERIIYDLNAPSTVADNLPEGTIGSPDAKYLFIGDCPNHDSIDVPFFALNGSSGYLNKAIEIAQIKENELAISNAFGPRGEIHDQDLIMGSLSMVEHVFLMGNKAKAWFKWPQGTVKVHSLPHPSYLRRFRGHNPQIMAYMIREKLFGTSH